MLRYLVWFGLLLLVPGRLLAQDYLAQAEAETNPVRKLEILNQALAQKPTKEVYWALGWAHCSLRQWALAATDFSSGLAAPGEITDPSFHACLGYVAYSQEDYTLALAYCDKSLAGSPTYTFPLQYKAYTLQALKRYGEAEQAANKFIAAAPKNAEAYYLRAGIRQDEKQYNDALADIDEALKLDAGNAYYLQRKILLLEALGRTSEVGAVASQFAAGFSADDPKSLTQLGAYFQGNGDYPSAIRFFKQALALHQKRKATDAKYVGISTFDYYNQLGFAQYLNGEYDQAYSSYVRAIQVDAKRHEAFLNVGYLQMARENYPEAAASFERCFVLNPACRDGWVNLGFAYSQFGDRKNAIRTYDRALLVPDVESKALILNNRGFCYLELDRYEEALADLQASIQTDPTIAMSYVSLGEYHIQMNHPEEAIPHLNKALDLNNRSLRESYVAYLRRGQASLALGNFAEALTDLERARQTDPTYADTYRRLGEAYMGLERYCDAIKSYNEVLRHSNWLDPAGTQEIALLLRRIEIEHPAACN